MPPCGYKYIVVDSLVCRLCVQKYVVKGACLKLGHPVSRFLHFLAVPLPPPPPLVRGEQVRLLGEAKKQLDPVDKLIEDAKWDAIRNIVKTSPLADVKVCCARCTTTV